MSTQPQQTQALAKVETSPMILELAGDWKISPSTMISTLKATIFKAEVSNEILVSFLQVCNTYKLNPFVKEIYAFPGKGGGFVPMVPIDGWANIINRNTNFDGLEFVDEWETHDGKKSLFSTTCIIYRKDRSHPIKVTEYMGECYDGGKDPWKRWPARMLRHKALIQCARIAFSLGGIYDPDEAERIAESNDKAEPAKPGRASAQVVEGQVATSASHAGAKVEDVPKKPGQAPAAKSEASGSPSQPQRGEAPLPQQGASPDKSGCICNCCKRGSCDCPGKEEMEQCGCNACMTFVKTPGPSASPSLQDIFNDEPTQRIAGQPQPVGEVLPSEKPAGPYVPQEKLRRLFVHAASAGIVVEKDSHDDQLHKLLKAKWNIDSIKEIPQAIFEEVLEEIAPQLKAAKAAKKK